MLLEEELSYQIRGSIYEVYRHLGHGFLERVYQRALFAELADRGLQVRCQIPLQVRCKGRVVGEYCADILVEERILLELKAQSRLTRTDEAQLLNYLRASDMHVGMLVNFTHPRAEIKRLVW
jgi:GxxExxY protein